MSNELSFEKAMKRLEEIVNCLENGNLTLDEALEAYNEGIKLSFYCNKKLEEAEGKIVKIINDNDAYKETDIYNELKE
ncbi:exodeoxyribonuclease VII small subunit [Lutispora saccharofermentans]|uniref:Exodeoxyribonuclease 7 small subunit n=1 Tax=Lutispora saccharofermentans TaxID=3024236 RepID=A0ABT1NF04_9FIRM|nr:exodeoxyribonuclease VII small subunit [Lutispora saccharofermentans]MCQ1529832.1 exodeoxyribonuclease VII small subunit [Lutispora saccharofermentans]